MFTCIWETKYNETSHWKQCIFCNNKINVVNHNMKTTELKLVILQNQHKQNIVLMNVDIRLPCLKSTF